MASPDLASTAVFEDAKQAVSEPLEPAVKDGRPKDTPRGGELHGKEKHVEVADSARDEEKILTLPPPPSYDVQITNLSIGVPPPRVYIPTPIPIPIPQIITEGLRRRLAKNNDAQAHQAAGPSPKDNLIVRDVTATVNRGEMMAIIGGSGSGKTTLLHAIANRLGGLPIVNGGVLFTPSEGSVGKDGDGPLGKKSLNKVVGFVRQHDYLLPHLTGASCTHCLLIRHAKTSSQFEKR